MRNRIFDNRYIVNLMVGFKPSRRWEFSVRWTTKGGTPYTPTNIELSSQLNKWILDESKYHEARCPNYSSVNFRLDKRWYFGKSSLIFFVDIWNIFGRLNVHYYWWNALEEIYEPKYQMEVLPILGLEFEF